PRSSRRQRRKHQSDRMVARSALAIAEGGVMAEHAEQPHASDAAPPLWLCASADEAERLALRDFDAIDGSIARDTAFYSRFRGRPIFVTPDARMAAFGAAAVLKAFCETVEVVKRNGVRFEDVEDPLTLPREPMFVEPEGGESEHR